MKPQLISFALLLAASAVPASALAAEYDCTVTLCKPDENGKVNCITFKLPTKITANSAKQAEDLVKKGKAARTVTCKLAE